jgi:hypothetical protein
MSKIFTTFKVTTWLRSLLFLSLEIFIVICLFTFYHSGSYSVIKKCVG